MMRWDRETFVHWQKIAAEEEAVKRGGRRVEESGIGVCFRIPTLGNTWLISV